MLTVKKIQTLQESWDDVIKHLRELCIYNPESVAIKVVKEDCKIIIIGHKNLVEEVAEKLKGSLQMLLLSMIGKKPSYGLSYSETFSAS